MTQLDTESLKMQILKVFKHFDDADILVKVSRGLGKSMAGLEIGGLETTFADRGW